MTSNGASSDPRGPEPAGVSAALATALATVSFFTLAIVGLGAVSVATDSDLISVPGIGRAPGVIAMAAAVAVFAGIEWLAVRIARPLYRSVWTTALSTALIHLLVASLSALIVVGDAVTALAVAADLIRGGTSIVILLAAAVAGWGGIALRRTRSSHPKWPWEGDE